VRVRGRAALPPHAAAEISRDTDVVDLPA
jgi:hypothetical protein